jgi:hypothetical protein
MTWRYYRPPMPKPKYVTGTSVAPVGVRATTAGLEPLLRGTPAVRATAAGLEALVAGVPAMRVSSVGLEVLIVPAPPATSFDPFGQFGFFGI